jgi:hypothetical protein
MLNALGGLAVYPVSQELQRPFVVIQSQGNDVLGNFLRGLTLLYIRIFVLDELLTQSIADEFVALSCCVLVADGCAHLSSSQPGLTLPALVVNDVMRGYVFFGGLGRPVVAGR